MDIHDLHRRALVLATGAVAAVDPDRLDLPTPCDGWTLRRLLEHMVGQNHGFADAARGDGDDLARWADRPLGDRPADTWRASADEVAAAFAAAGPGAVLRIPEIRPGTDFPVDRAVSFHFLDLLVHAWDVATTVGHPVEVDEDLAVALLDIAGLVPADPAYRATAGQFGAVVETGPGASAFDRALALLGRDPAWAPAPA
ncbi:TIGR03086 family metal-binding protein [Kitasatospora sp. NBC_01560]|uniref:TIGR03086 family metal-binding protein n=1 Tax=Kitasatospora sp. NBC_01560 TaxID=2975965 RepID=UPI0038702D83